MKWLVCMYVRIILYLQMIKKGLFVYNIQHFGSEFQNTHITHVI